MRPVTVRLGNALGTAAQAARPPKPAQPAKPPAGITNPYITHWWHTTPQQQGQAQQQANNTPHVPGFPGGPPAPGNPAQTAPTATAPANSATTQQPSPLDAAYYAAVNSNTFKVGNQIAGLGLQGSQADTALQSALGQLAYQQPRDELALEQRANQGGGLYSSVYGQNLGNLNHQYLTNQTAAQTRNTNAHDTISQRVAALEGGIPIYNADQAALSAARVAKLTAANPGTGQGTGGLNTNPPPTTGGSGGGSGSHSGGSGKKSGGKGHARNRLAFKVGQTLPTLKGKPSPPSKNPPTKIARPSALPGHGLVRTHLTTKKGR